MLQFMIWFFRKFIFPTGASMNGSGSTRYYNHGPFHMEIRADWGDGLWVTYMAIIIFMHGKRFVPWQESLTYSIV